MSNGVHAGVDPVEATCRGSLGHRTSVEAESDQLAQTNHAVLAPGQQRDLRIQAVRQAYGSSRDPDIGFTVHGR